uniref:MobA/MobL protein domain-containing protein n=1 Tax=uncultured prokaryote TaxID=198431 RepID=A0A0H5QFT8_9ZZZZ|nr:hypothetical protein [uncultured prokaryote]
MDCVFVKARKISKSLKGNRGSAVNYSKYLDRTLKGIDYAEKGKLLSSGIEGTEESPLAFWKKAEERELQTKRKDTARFAKEYIVGLPHNLPIEEMQKICEIISKELSKNGRVVSWYLHEPDFEESSDERNFHSHFLLSEREYNSQKGIFAEIKNRDWNTKATLQNHKKIIGGFINERLRALKLSEIKIELQEDEKIGINKTENQIKAQKANSKMLKKAERKIKLAEVKLNGLGRNERQLANAIDGNSKSDNGLAEQFAEYQKLERTYSDFQQAERLREAEQRNLEEQRRRAEQERKEYLQRLEQQRKLEAERNRQQADEHKRNNKKIDNGYSGIGY